MLVFYYFDYFFNPFFQKRTAKKPHQGKHAPKIASTPESCTYGMRPKGLTLRRSSAHSRAVNSNQKLSYKFAKYEHFRFIKICYNIDESVPTDKERKREW